MICLKFVYTGHESESEPRAIISQFSMSGQRGQTDMSFDVVSEEPHASPDSIGLAQSELNPHNQTLTFCLSSLYI